MQGYLEKGIQTARGSSNASNANGSNTNGSNAPRLEQEVESLKQVASLLTSPYWACREPRARNLLSRSRRVASRLILLLYYSRA